MRPRAGRFLVISLGDLSVPPAGTCPLLSLPALSQSCHPCPGPWSLFQRGTFSF